MEKGKFYYYVEFEYEKEASGFGLGTRSITDRGSVAIRTAEHAFTVSGQLDSLKAAIDFYVKEFTRDIKKAEKSGNNCHTSSLNITVGVVESASCKTIKCVYRNGLYYRFGGLDRQYYQVNGNAQLEIQADGEGRKPAIHSSEDIKSGIMSSIRIYEKETYGDAE